MNALVGKLIVRGGIWTVGVYCISVAVRFCSSVVLSRFLTPDILGAVVIITTLRTGAELLTDVGVGQNIVTSAHGEKASFRNTAWTIQLARGVLLSVIFTALSGIAAANYAVPQDALIISATTFLFMGAASTSIYLMQRRLQVARLNLFDLTQDVIAAICVLVAASISPTLWAVLIAQVAAVAVRTGSSFLLTDGRNWLTLDRTHAVSILTWGKWIYLWSIFAFLSVNFDRIFLGKATSLELLGLYGLARSIADLPVALAGRLGHSLIFPLLSSFSGTSRTDLRKRTASLRFSFLLVTAFGLASAVAFGDMLIGMIYDARYAESGWMLPLLLVCAWGTILCIVSEYSFLGIGKPLYGTAANGAKLVCLVGIMPVAFAHWGLAGAIIALGLSECCRYASLIAGQVRERLVFVGQDLGASVIFVLCILSFTEVREAAGFGSVFDLMLWK